jgi:hypothetical protein
MSFQKRCFALLAASFGTGATAICAQPAYAEALTFTCGFGQARIDLLNQAKAMGIYLGDPKTRFNFRIDMDARTAVDLAFPNNTYPATITASQFSWSLPRDEDDDYAASFSLDRATNEMTSVDPTGEKTVWDCSRQ